VAEQHRGEGFDKLSPNGVGMSTRTPFALSLSKGP